MNNTTIYLDHAANALVRQEVLDVFQATNITYIANPNASHALGKQAWERQETANANIATYFGVKPNELIYTSGATEANNLAIKGLVYANRQYGKHIISSYLEHSSVLGSLMALQEEGFEIEFVDILDDGSINLEHLNQLLRKDTILVTLAAVDSEIGLRQDIASIYALVKKLPHCAFHTDATQSIGKLPINAAHYDALTCSPHKFGGLNGFGLLILKEQHLITPQIHGGISNTPYRSGTPVLPMICALETALALCQQTAPDNLVKFTTFHAILHSFFGSFQDIVINSKPNGSPYIVNISFKTIKGDQLMEKLSEQQIYVSTKSACCAVNTPSKPVLALTKNRKLALSTLRISMGPETTEHEIEQFKKVFQEQYHMLGGN